MFFGLTKWFNRVYYYVCINCKKSHAPILAEQVELKIKLVFVSLSWEFIVKFEVAFCSVDWWKQAVQFSFGS